MEIVLVRHGETTWSLSGRHTGRTDIPLTDEGRRQAKLLGPRLAGWAFALVLSSPLSRAAETCALAGLTPTTCDDLLEWDYDYEGRTTPEIRTIRPGWLVWTGGAPNGETVADVGRRADGVIERVRAIDGDVALFAHGHVLRVLAARWLDLPPGPAATSRSRRPRCRSCGPSGKFRGTEGATAPASQRRRHFRAVYRLSSSDPQRREAGCRRSRMPRVFPRGPRGWEHEVPAILRWNDGSHLEG